MLQRVDSSSLQLDVHLSVGTCALLLTWILVSNVRARYHSKFTVSTKLNSKDNRYEHFQTCNFTLRYPFLCHNVQFQPWNTYWSVLKSLSVNIQRAARRQMHSRENLFTEFRSSRSTWRTTRWWRTRHRPQLEHCTQNPTNHVI